MDKILAKVFNLKNNIKEKIVLIFLLQSLAVIPAKSFFAFET